jgi:LacI family transcriptional regulator
MEQGRRRIGIITGPMAWWEARERHAGWKGALAEAGFGSPAALEVESYWSAAGGERAMQQLLEQTPEVDAVFACSDQIALGALQTLHQAGRSVPRDVAVVGFDNMPESAFFWPPLSTVYQKLVSVGQKSVQNLHRMIEMRRKERGTLEASTALIEPELIIRASSIVLPNP